MPPLPLAVAILLAGYVETSYQAERRAPARRTFAVDNAALDVSATRGPVSARVIAQSGAWGPLQRATVAIRAPGAITVEAGRFASPIGPEVIAVKDDWNWSRSTGFAALPAFHTGVQLGRPLGAGWTATVHAYDGWNTAVDDNRTPSPGASLLYAGPRTSAQVMYLGGVERGRTWRHLVDAFVQHAITDDVSVLAHADAGRDGADAWLAGALYARVALAPRIAAAVRVDGFYERAGGTDDALFWPATWVGAATATVAFEPVDGASVRVEVRRDRRPAIQDTATLGVTAWF
jgi:hypothetical protein